MGCAGVGISGTEFSPAHSVASQQGHSDRLVGLAAGAAPMTRISLLQMMFPTDLRCPKRLRSYFYYRLLCTCAGVCTDGAQLSES